MKIIKSTFFILKKVIQIIPLYFIFSIITIILNAILVWGQLYIIEQTVTMVELGNSTFKEILLFIVVLSCINLFCSSVNRFFGDYLKPKYRHTWMKKIQYLLYEKAKELPIEYYDDPKKYDELSRALKQDLSSINAFDNFINFVKNIVSMAVMVVYICVNVPILFIITLFASIINIVCGSKILKIYHDEYKETELDRRKRVYVARVFYLEKYTMDIKTTNVGEMLKNMEKEGYEAVDTRCNNDNKKSRKWYFLDNGIYYVLNQFIIYFYLMYSVFFKGMLIGKFSALASACHKFSGRFYSLVSSFTSLRRNLIEIEDFVWLLNYQPEKEIENDNNVIDFKEVHIQNLSFAYPNQEQPSLQNISIQIKRGQKIAIIGYNGAGKTTLTKLLLKLYPPLNGEIFIDDMDYPNINRKQISSLFSIVLQNFQIYCATVLENILMHRPNNDEEKEKAIHALKKVGLYEKVMEYPNGLDTILTKEFNNDGIELSGGERQRMVLARVFASDAPIIILDEPTSALDPTAEKNINDEIMRLCEEENKTLILISHRLSTIVNVDTIYMMKEGQIIEEGNHHSLMLKKGSYYEMFEAQAKLYRES